MAKSPAQTHGFPQLLRCPGAGHAGSGHRSSAGAVPIASDPAWGLSSIRYLTDERNGRSKSSCLRSVPTCLTRRWTCGCFLTSIVQFFKNSWFAMTILTVPVKPSNKGQKLTRCCITSLFNVAARALGHLVKAGVHPQGLCVSSGSGRFPVLEHPSKGEAGICFSREKDVLVLVSRCVPLTRAVLGVPRWAGGTEPSPVLSWCGRWRL